MRRVGKLWAGIASFDNLRVSALRAARGKRRVAGVARFLADLEPEVLRLERELRLALKDRATLLAPAPQDLP